MRLKFKVGLFEKPYADVTKKECLLCDEHRGIARDAARKSIVLLKNDNKLLPLSKKLKIAVVGSAASDKEQMYGCWSFTGEWENAVTLVDALK